jgi:hypothetical protein
MVIARLQRSDADGRRDRRILVWLILVRLAVLGIVTSCVVTLLLHGYALGGALTAVIGASLVASEVTRRLLNDPRSSSSEPASDEGDGPVGGL